MHSHKKDVTMKLLVYWSIYFATFTYGLVQALDSDQMNETADTRGGNEHPPKGGWVFP